LLFGQFLAPFLVAFFNLVVHRNLHILIKFGQRSSS
jgi:hypothetical protein